MKEEALLSLIDERMSPVQLRPINRFTTIFLGFLIIRVGFFLQFFHVRLLNVVNVPILLQTFWQHIYLTQIVFLANDQS